MQSARTSNGISTVDHTHAPVRRESDHSVATLTLSRPEARNALSVALMTGLLEELDAVARDPEIRVVIIAAEGPAFCAGHDLKEIRANPDRAFYEQLFEQCSRLMQALVALPKPVIASVQGMATAAGCQLVASCDLAVAGHTAGFATPGVAIGLFCSTPMVALSRAIGRKQAMEMLLTGDTIDADTAVRYGLINRVVDDAELRSATKDLAARLAERSPLTMAIGKETFYRQDEMPLSEAYAYTSDIMVRNMMARDAEEGIDAFLSKRPPTWSGR